MLKQVNIRLIFANDIFSVSLWCCLSLVKLGRQYLLMRLAKNH